MVAWVTAGLVRPGVSERFGSTGCPAPGVATVGVLAADELFELTGVVVKAGDDSGVDIGVVAESAVPVGAVICVGVLPLHPARTNVVVSAG